MFQSSSAGAATPLVIAEIAGWINSSLGIFFPEQKYPILFHKLTKVCVSRGMTLEEIWQQVKAGGDASLVSELAAAVSTNHTSFFREDIWDYFSDTIIPSLPENDKWRIWSAAASAGHEAYTIAMVVSARLGADRAVSGAAILGTDISFKVLKEAERAIYTDEMVRHVPQEYRAASFEPAGPGMWKVKKHLCQMCLFRRLNLKVQPWPMKQKFHVIFCRNVLYYFDTKTRESVINGLYKYATDGGWLITSATETMRDINTSWVPVRPAVYRKK